jgi:hypothetical protein
MKGIPTKIRIIISKFLISIIVSLVLFYIVDTDWNFYFCTLIIIGAIVGLNIKMDTNLELYDSLVMICIGNFAGIIVFLFFTKPQFTYLNIACMCFYWSMILIISLYSRYFDLKKETQSKPVKLLKKRQRDLERLIDCIGSYEIIALNGRWGTGKTLLIDELKKKKDIIDNYEIIEIDVLACNLNELLIILTKELESLLYKNKIISRHTKRLKKFFGNNSISSQFQNLVFDNSESYSSTIKGLQNEISRLKKDVLIIYEDIDRINDTDTIKKIFSINEKLSCEHIRIIYQYHESNLKNMGFTDDYLEKYLPFKVNVTESRLRETIRFILKNESTDETILKIDDFYFLEKNFQQNRYTVLSKEFGLGMEIDSEFRNLPFRKVKNFYTELIRTLKTSDYLEYKDTVISFFVIKHFMPPIYEQLNIEEGLLETIKFEVDGIFYTMPELLKAKESDLFYKYKLEKAFKSDENRRKYGVLKYFDYLNISGDIEENIEKRYKGILEESENSVRQKNSNDKKDHIIWNLLAAGKSEYTDYESAGRKLIDNVLKKPENEREKAFRSFENDLYFSEENESDNRTINMMGIPFFIDLFKAFRVLRDGGQYTKELVDLYFEVGKIDAISPEVIQILNYALLPDIGTYVHMLKKINNLEVTGNMNTAECFFKFINKFLGDALPNLGIISTRDYFIFEAEFTRGKIERSVDELDKIKNEIENLKANLLNFEIIKDDIGVILEFIDKLMEIIKEPNELKVPRKPIVKIIPGGSRFIHQEEFDKLKIILDTDPDKAKKEIEKSYKLGKITPHEIKNLFKNS